MNAIEFKGVTKRFGDVAVLDNLSFSVRKGEIFVIIGPSGTGKSVTLKHAVGLIEPDEGTIDIHSDRIGYLFQSGALLAWKTIYENVALPLEENTDLKEEAIEAKVMEALRAVGLEEDAEKYPSEISGGMQKRAGLARVLVCEAEIILYDEPTSGLDPVTAEHISRLIRDISRTRGVTSVLVTHDLLSAMKLADRIMLINHGRCVLCATPEAFAQSNDPGVREFLTAIKGEGL